MLHFVVAACLEDVVESDEIGFHIGVRIGYGITHSGLGCEIDYDSGAVVREKPLHQIPVGNAALDKGPVAPEGFDFPQPFVFDIYIVIIRDRVDSDDSDVPDIGKQSFDQVGSDETGGAGHENGLSIKSHILLQHRQI